MASFLSRMLANVVFITSHISQGVLRLCTDARDSNLAPVRR